jgi:hypothetical protein
MTISDSYYFVLRPRVTPDPHKAAFEIVHQCILAQPISLSGYTQHPSNLIAPLATSTSQPPPSSLAATCLACTQCHCVLSSAAHLRCHICHHLLTARPCGHHNLVAMESTLSCSSVCADKGKGIHRVGVVDQPQLGGDGGVVPTLRCHAAPKDRATHIGIADEAFSIVYIHVLCVVLI